MNIKIEFQPDSSSFRDPAGFIFSYQNKIYRQVNPAGSADYDLLMSSGLYHELVKKDWLVPHQEAGEEFETPISAYKILLPEQIPFISYPYEWSFDMLKDAALLTLDICLFALKHGMVIKDATPFNVQFYKGKPVFIDTLSFTKYVPGKPWVAYRQFCEMFAGPLVLAHYRGNDAIRFLQAFLAGVPVQMVSKLLPFRSYFSGLSLLDFHLQSLVSLKSAPGNALYNFSLQKFTNLLSHLKQGVSGLTGPKTKTVWDDYYDVTIASDVYLAEKDKIFREFLSVVDAKTAIDLGANNGYFSMILSEKGIDVIATDFDSNSINHLYKKTRKEKVTNILPLILDLTNPSPALGWANKERSAFIDRSTHDLVIALALVHHLAIGNNIPLPSIAAVLSGMCKRYLIVEFVAQEDEKARILLGRKEISYAEYNRENFERVMQVNFLLIKSSLLLNGNRALYLYQKIGAGNDEQHSLS